MLREKMPAGSKRMLPRIRKWADYGICLSCFDKWKLNGGDIVYINNTSPRKQAPRIKKEHVIHMSNILKGNCDIIKGRKLYVALKKVINSGKTIVLKFDTDQPICMSTRVMNPSFGEIMDEYGKDIFQGKLKLTDVPKGVKDLIVNYIEKNSMSDIKEKAIKLAIEAMKPIPVYSSPCYSINDNRSPEEKHEEDMRFCKEFNDLKCEMLIDMAKKIEEYLL